MSVYFEFECSECSKQGGRLSRYSGGRWDAGIIETFKFFAHHLERCDSSAFLVRSDMDADGEYLARVDTEFIPAMAGRFPHSDDWDLVAQAEDVTKLDEQWSVVHQRSKEEDAAASEEE